jgi:hypothetical protein
MESIENNPGETQIQSPYLILERIFGLGLKQKLAKRALSLTPSSSETRSEFFDSVAQTTVSNIRRQLNENDSLEGVIIARAVEFAFKTIENDIINSNPSEQAIMRRNICDYPLNNDSKSTLSQDIAKSRMYSSRLDSALRKAGGVSKVERLQDTIEPAIIRLLPVADDGTIKTRKFIEDFDVALRSPIEAQQVLLAPYMGNKSLRTRLSGRINERLSKYRLHKDCSLCHRFVDVGIFITPNGKYDMLMLYLHFSYLLKISVEEVETNFGCLSILLDFSMHQKYLDIFNGLKC